MPALAVKPLWKTTAASVCLNAASRRSSSMWIAIVPAIVRTEPGADAEAPNRLERALAQQRVRGQAEIVVRGEVDDRAVVDRGVRRLLAVEHAQPAIETLLAQRVQLVVEVAERIRSHRRASIAAGRLKPAFRPTSYRPHVPLVVARRGRLRRSTTHANRITTQGTIATTR